MIPPKVDDWLKRAAARTSTWQLRTGPGPHVWTGTELALLDAWWTHPSTGLAL